MNNLITYTDFTFPFLPDVTSSTAIAKLTSVITLSQKDFLIYVLGVTEYNKLVACTSVITPSLSHWVDFISGKTYINADGITVIYPGIIEALKLYCFFMSNRYNSSLTGPTGEQTPLYENSQGSNPNHKNITAYNRMSEIIDGDINSVYEFLSFYSTLFPDYEYKSFKKINNFGI